MGDTVFFASLRSATRPTPTAPCHGLAFSEADNEEKIIAITVDDCFQADGVAYKLKCTSIVPRDKFQEGQAVDLLNAPNNPTHFHLDQVYNERLVENEYGGFILKIGLARGLMV